MDKYHKIETLFEFDLGTKKFKHGVFFNKTVELLKDYIWEFTEKIDGTNLRLNWDGHNMTYGGRKDNSEFETKRVKWIEENIATPAMEQALEHTFKTKDVTIFGELHGFDINKGYGYCKDDYRFRVFDIKMPISEKPISRKYVTRKVVESIAKTLNFDTAPVVFRGTIDEAIEYVKNNPKSTFSDAPLEGLVGVPVGNLLDQNGERIIVKIKLRDLGE